MIKMTFSGPSLSVWRSRTGPSERRASLMKSRLSAGGVLTVLLTFFLLNILYYCRFQYKINHRTSRVSAELFHTLYDQTEVTFGVFVLQSLGGQHSREQGQSEAHAHRGMERFTKPSWQEEDGELSCRAEERGQHVLVQCSHTGQCQPPRLLCNYKHICLFNELKSNKWQFNSLILIAFYLILLFPRQIDYVSLTCVADLNEAEWPCIAVI